MDSLDTKLYINRKINVETCKFLHKTNEKWKLLESINMSVSRKRYLNSTIT